MRTEGDAAVGKGAGEAVVVVVVEEGGGGGEEGRRAAEATTEAAAVETETGKKEEVESDLAPTVDAATNEPGRRVVGGTSEALEYAADEALFAGTGCR